MTTRAKAKTTPAPKGAAPKPATAAEPTAPVPEHEGSAQIQTDTTEGTAPANVAEAFGVSPEAGAADAADTAAEDLARKAEAVAKPGDNVNDMVAAQRQAPEPGEGSHLVVRALVEGGFRRAGRSWSEAPTTVFAEHFTPEQIAALEAEPLLDVRRIERADDEAA